ncbi:MAG TPA: hypothetical protein VMH23_05045 [Bacteroidota bacterium]|nr:hypothetical protein [Bacteroidota bacterium]
MRQFFEERQLELLLIFAVMAAAAVRWVPSVSGFELIYGASHWVLSYTHGLVRRGLVGSIFKLWVPVVSIGDVHRAALVAYCVFLGAMLFVFYRMLRRKDGRGGLFWIILLFVACPATVSMYGRDLSRFDLFLVMILGASFFLLSVEKQTWLIPLLMVAALFIHEGFLILCAPTILAAMLIMVVRSDRSRRMLWTLAVSAVFTGSGWFLLYRFGTPALGYDEFVRVIQARAAFPVTELSMRECYYSIGDHMKLASPYLRDPGSMLNLAGALMMLSPVLLVLVDLWRSAIRNSVGHRSAVVTLMAATLSGLLIIPIATDYGRWLSGVVFCNFFAVLFLVSQGIIGPVDLQRYQDSRFCTFLGFMVLVYLLFGPLHDWNPYPFQQRLTASAFFMTSALAFDAGFVMWRLRNRANPV